MFKSLPRTALSAVARAVGPVAVCGRSTAQLLVTLRRGFAQQASAPAARPRFVVPQQQAVAQRAAAAAEEESMTRDDDEEEDDDDQEVITHLSSSEDIAAAEKPPADAARAEYEIGRYNLMPELENTLRERFGITHFFPIQAHSLELVQAGKDLIGKSRTGSGKTLAFCLPLVQRLLTEKARARPGHVKVLIMEPTRELAKQVHDEIMKLTTKLNVVVVYGKTSIERQARDMESGVDILIATPGRLLDHIDRRNCTLEQTHTVVLDEADEMLKMGFQDDVERIFSNCEHPRRQTMLFSATVPRWVKDMEKKYLKSAVTLDFVGEVTTPQTIRHMAMLVPSGPDRFVVLRKAIETYAPREKVIVFCDTKSATSEFAAHPAMSKDCRPLHGDISQRTREDTMRDFKSGEFRILAATDVAARGIDVSDVGLVIQMGLPLTRESYIHRSGRTGRAGKDGKCLIVYEYAARSRLTSLATMIGVKLEYVPPPGNVSEGDQIAKYMADVELCIDRIDDRWREHLTRLTAKYSAEQVALGALTYGGRDVVPNSRSILTSRSGYTAIFLPGRRAAVQVRQTLAGFVSLNDIGTVEIVRDGAVVDVLSSEVNHLLKLGIEILEELPAELYSRENFSDMSFKSKAGGGRFQGNDGARGGGGGGGGRGGYGGGGYGGGRDRERDSSYARPGSYAGSSGRSSTPYQGRSSYTNGGSGSGSNSRANGGGNYESRRSNTNEGRSSSSSSSSQPPRSASSAPPPIYKPKAAAPAEPAVDSDRLFKLLHKWK